MKACTHFETLRYDTARHDHAVLCIALHLQCISFRKDLLFFHLQKRFQFTNIVSEHNCFTRTCHVLSNLRTALVTLPNVLANECVSLNYGGVTNRLCNVDIPDTKFLWIYLLNLNCAMCSTAHNRLGHCSKFSIK